MSFITLGETIKYPRPFGLNTEDHRRHLYLIGRTGTGKTTLLLNILYQHIHWGHGFCLIDPHGDLAEEILNYIPKHRIHQTIYFDPADIEYPTSFNILANIPAERRATYASGMVSAFKSIWYESWGPRMEHILKNSILALLDCQNVSLLSLLRLLSEEQYRAWVVRQIQDPSVRAFWEREFAQFDPRFAKEAVAPIQNKAGQFVNHPMLRNILGQVKRKIDIKKVMDNNGIFIANLSKGKLGEDNSNLMGSLLVNLFQFEAIGRAELPEEQRKDYYLILDEFQNFGTNAFATILSESRKYRLSLTLAHQYLSQLQEHVMPAILGNVGTLIAFNVGHFDSEILSKEFGEYYPPYTYISLGKYQTICRLMQNGEATGEFRARTLAPDFVHIGMAEEVKKFTRVHYAEPRAVVEDKIKRWYGNFDNERRHGKMPHHDRNTFPLQKKRLSPYFRANSQRHRNPATRL